MDIGCRAWFFFRLRWAQWCVFEVDMLHDGCRGLFLVWFVYLVNDPWEYRKARRRDWIIDGGALLPQTVGVVEEAVSQKNRLLSSEDMNATSQQMFGQGPLHENEYALHPSEKQSRPPRRTPVNVGGIQDSCVMILHFPASDIFCSK